MSLFLLFEESSEELIGSDDSETNTENNGDNDNGKKFRRKRSGQQGHDQGQDDKPISSVVKAIWVVVLVIMSSFFLAAAYVQHNDPDPYIWMPAYLVPSFVNFCLIFFALHPNRKRFENYLRIVNWIITCHICYCYTLGFWTLVHYIHRQIWGDEQTIKILEEMVSERDMVLEEAKELIGLCLVIAWLSFVSNGNFLRFGVWGVAVGSLLTGLPIVSWIFVEKLEENWGDQECF